MKEHNLVSNFDDLGLICLDNGRKVELDEDLFLGNMPVEQIHPSLVDDLILPTFANKKKDPLQENGFLFIFFFFFFINFFLWKGNVWIGNNKHASHLHFDSHHGFLNVICGKKEVLLFEPIKHQNIFQFKKEFGNAATFNPLFDFNEQARYMHCTLEAGDTLFLPSFFWHFIFSSESSIAVNFWIYPHFDSTFDKFEKYFFYTKLDILFHIDHFLQNENARGFNLFLDQNIRLLYLKSLRGVEGSSDPIVWNEFYEKTAKPLIVQVIIEYLQNNNK